MRRLGLLIVLTLLLCLPIGGQAAELDARWTHDTGQFPCDNQFRTYDWGTAPTKYIKSLRLWLGMAKGSISDFNYYLELLPGGVNVGRILVGPNWDHYLDPSNLRHFDEVSFTPDYFAIRPGDILRLSVACSNLSGNAAGHAMVFIRFSTTP